MRCLTLLFALFLGLVMAEEEEELLRPTRVVNGLPVPLGGYARYYVLLVNTSCTRIILLITQFHKDFAILA